MSTEAPTFHERRRESDQEIAQTLRQGFLEAAKGFPETRDLVSEEFGSAEIPYFGTTLRLSVTPNGLNYSEEDIVNGSKQVEAVHITTGEEPKIEFVRTVTRLTKSAEPRIRPELNKETAIGFAFGKLLKFRDMADRLRL